MNERIEELVKQSGGEFWQRLENDAVNPEAYITFDPPESLDKFVELIVREMCQVMKAEGEQFSLDQNFDAVKGVGRCMRKVKEHFGVEE
jgi:hypothetical protein